MTKKYGKLAPIHFDGLEPITSYLTATLAPAPAEVKPPGIGDWPGVVLSSEDAPPSAIEWGMLGNGPDASVTWKGDNFNNEEGCGDCTVCGYAHGEEAVTWDEAEHVAKHMITGNEAVEEYYTLTGGVDSGLVCGGVLMKGYVDGLFGAKNLGFGELAGTIETIDFNLLDQVINSFGLAYIGINCPASAEQQFDDNMPWSVVEGSPIEGGHCIILVGYLTANSVKYYVAVTWGQFVFIEEAFLRQYMDEAWAVLMPAIAQRGELKKVSLIALQNDLAAVAPGYHDVTSGGSTSGEESGGLKEKFDDLAREIFEKVPGHIIEALKSAHKLEEAIAENATVDTIEIIVRDLIKAYAKGMVKK
jgi:hypothetical protein